MLADDCLQAFLLEEALYLCNLCKKRVADGTEIPSCVKHCQAGCMKYGPVSELVKEMETDNELMLVVPR